MSARKAPISSDPSLNARTSAFCDSIHAFAKRLSVITTQLRRSPSVASSQPQALASLAEALSRSSDLHESANKLRAEWDSVVSLAFLQLEASLHELCGSRGWRLDGQWPDFIVEFGITLHVDESHHSILVGDTKRIHVDELEEALAGATADLLPKNFAPRAFMEKLLSAYDSVANGERSQVPILSLYREMVTQNQTPKFWKDASYSAFTPFTIAQFRARVSRMLEAGILNAVDGRELHLFPPLNPKDAIFIFQPQERRFGFIGRIEFCK